VSVIEKKREYYYECGTLLRVLYIYGSQFLSKFQKGVRAFVQNLYPNIINYKAEHLFYSNINCNTFNSQYSIEQTHGNIYI